MHSKIDVVDEERYDYEAKVIKNNRDVWRQLHQIKHSFFFWY